MRKSQLAAARLCRRFRYLLPLALIAVSTGCASGDHSLDTVDPNAVAADPTYDQVYAIIQNKCVLCHDSGGEGGEDFQVGVVAEDDAPPFTTCTEIVSQRDEILARVEDNTMPPGALPRLTSEEKLVLQRWIANGAPAPCN